jgi:hypothetical protein
LIFDEARVILTDMFKTWFEQLRRMNRKQLETIRQHDDFSSDIKRGFVRGKLVLFLLFTLVLCIADGLLTIQLLNLGAWEANPLMRRALSMGIGFFIFSKYFLTAGGLLVLLRYGKVRILHESITLEEIAAGVILFYQGLVLYEIECYLILT